LLKNWGNKGEGGSEGEARLGRHEEKPREANRDDSGMWT